MGGLGGLKPPQIFSHHEVIYVASNIYIYEAPPDFLHREVIFVAIYSMMLKIIILMYIPLLFI